VVFVAAGIAAKDWIREEWWLWKLEKGNKEEQEGAARTLGGMRSVRAVPLLINALRQAADLRLEAKAAREPPGLGSVLAASDWYLGEHGVRFRKALIEIGRPATFELLKAIRDRGQASVFALAHLGQTLVQIHDSEFEVLLLGLKEDPSQPSSVHQVAVELLTRNRPAAPPPAPRPADGSSQHLPTISNAVSSNRTTRPTLRRGAAGGMVATTGAILRILAPCGQRRRGAVRLSRSARSLRRWSAAWQAGFVSAGSRSSDNYFAGGSSFQISRCNCHEPSACRFHTTTYFADAVVGSFPSGWMVNRTVPTS